VKSKHPVMAYIQKAIKKSEFHSVQHLCQRNGMNYDNVSHYLRSEYKFNLHTFIALVELLELDLQEFYSLIYNTEKDKGML
jgi:hypothetical protein